MNYMLCELYLNFFKKETRLFIDGKISQKKSLTENDLIQLKKIIDNSNSYEYGNLMY